MFPHILGVSGSIVPVYSRIFAVHGRISKYWNLELAVYRKIKNISGDWYQHVTPTGKPKAFYNPPKGSVRMTHIGFFDKSHVPGSRYPFFGLYTPMYDVPNYAKSIPFFLKQSKKH